MYAPNNPTTVPAPDPTQLPAPATDPAATPPTTDAPTSDAPADATAAAPVAPTATLGQVVRFEDVDPYTGSEYSLLGLVVAADDSGADVVWLAAGDASAHLPWDTIKPVA